MSYEDLNYHDMYANKRLVYLATMTLRDSSNQPPLQFRSTIYCLESRLGVLGLDEYADAILYGVEYPDRLPLCGV